MPYADADMMHIPPDEISGNVADAHAVLILDRAGWRTTASSTRSTTSPRYSRAPELNPVGNVRRSLRQNWLSNTAFENYDAIIDAAAPPGDTLSPSPKRSPPSECATRPMSVRRHDFWYHFEEARLQVRSGVASGDGRARRPVGRGRPRPAVGSPLAPVSLKGGP